MQTSLSCNFDNNQIQTFKPKKFGWL